MPEPTAGSVLRQLQQAQASLKKARQALRLARTGEAEPDRVLAAGWQSLARTFQVLAEIPLSAVNDDVMTRQLAVQRYATGLLVRLRRLARGGGGDLEGLDDEDDEE
jgi:hypothetical protein